MTASEFIERADKDRYALIIESELEDFAHNNLKEILDLYPCTGILVKRCTNKVKSFYHETTPDRADVIVQVGEMLPTDECYATFGEGVIYTYPTLKPKRPSNARLELEYVGPYLEAIFTDDKDDLWQGETLLYPEYVKNITLQEGASGPSVKKMSLK